MVNFLIGLIVVCYMVNFLIGLIVVCYMLEQKTALGMISIFVIWLLWLRG